MISNQNFSQAAQIGLHESQFAELMRVLAEFEQIQEVVVFGSRAKGNFHERSDLDLALRLENSDWHLLGRIQAALDDSDLVTPVEVQNLDEISNPALLDHIKRRGISLLAL